MVVSKELPVQASLDQLLAALDANNAAVLVAPPGAGKSTAVPLALLHAGWAKDGKIIMLEPRRVAARRLATFLASTLGEAVGKTIGYRVRMDTKVSAATRLEIVTEGVFTRMMLKDPSLAGIVGVIFDEFHERSLDSDAGLALAHDVQAGLREDLRLLVMSATLDGARVANLLHGAPLIQSEGRQFPVERQYAPRPANEKIHHFMAKTIRQTLLSSDGDILCFLPGQAEILRVMDALQDRVSSEIMLAPLYGALSPNEQDAAIAPTPPGKRKVVLATNIAETSLTIEGITIVIDSGLSRQPKYDQASGLTHLVTNRASWSSVEQRAGRAGRLGPGRVIRLWHEGQNGSLDREDRPEILETDLSGLVIALADFGIQDPGQLKWLDPPLKPAWQRAVEALKSLGVLNKQGRLTELGSRVSDLPLPPSLAAMLVRAGDYGQAGEAAKLAVLMTERGVGGTSIDVENRLKNLNGCKSDREKRALKLAASLARSVKGPSGQINRRSYSIGALLSLGMADRIAMNRGTNGSFLLANGKGAMIDEIELLAKERFLLAADLQGGRGSAHIRLASALSLDEIEDLHGDAIRLHEVVRFDPNQGSVVAETQRKFGQLVLGRERTENPDPEKIARCLMKHIQEKGVQVLAFEGEAKRMREQVMFLHGRKPDDWPGMDDETLTAELDEWLLPFLIGKRSIAQITPSELYNALVGYVGYERSVEIKRLLPSHFTAPTGSRIPIRYETDAAVLPVRVQELFGLKTHPTIGDGQIPLVVELLSPAHRPIQTTMDLPGFWSGSWSDVRADMRGRYPKHVWPVDPANTEPTARAKPRKN